MNPIASLTGIHQLRFPGADDADRSPRLSSPDRPIQSTSRPATQEVDFRTSLPTGALSARIKRSLSTTLVVGQILSRNNISEPRLLNSQTKDLH